MPPGPSSCCSESIGVSIGVVSMQPNRANTRTLQAAVRLRFAAHTSGPRRTLPIADRKARRGAGCRRTLTTVRRACQSVLRPTHSEPLLGW